MRFLLLLALLVASGVQAAAIERFKSFVRTTQSARADFEQKVYDRNRKLVQESKGNFVLLRPGRFRWAYDKPVDQLIVGDGVQWLEAKPRDREAGFERIRMGLGSDGIEAMELTDNFGQTTLLRFFNLVRNPKVDPAQFRFVPPKGADVLGDQ